MKPVGYTSLINCDGIYPYAGEELYAFALDTVRQLYEENRLSPEELVSELKKAGFDVSIRWAEGFLYYVDFMGFLRLPADL